MGRKERLISVDLCSVHSLHSRHLSHFLTVNPEDVPAHVLEKEKQRLMEQMPDTGKPASEILENICWTHAMKKFV